MRSGFYFVKVYQVTMALHSIWESFSFYHGVNGFYSSYMLGLTVGHQCRKKLVANIYHASCFYNCKMQGGTSGLSSSMKLFKKCSSQVMQVGFAAIDQITYCWTIGAGFVLNLRRQQLQCLGVAGKRCLLVQSLGWTIERFKLQTLSQKQGGI